MHPAPTGAPAPALPRDDDERGSMLIVALGILALLSVLALTFVKLMNLERQATANYVDGVRSRMIAEGGLERALAQLKLTLSASAFSDPSASWVYAAGDPSLPLEEASSDPNADPRIKASFAGRLGVSYGAGLAAKADEDPWGDSYRIKVLDTQTQFNLNSHFDLKAASTSAPGTGDSFDTDPGYVRFLDALGQAIAELNPRANRRNPILHARYPRATGTSARNAARGGEAILRFRQSREGQQFRSKAELLEILDNEEDFLLLKDYITCYSWRDPKTVVAASTGDEGDVLNFRKKSWNQVKQANSKERRSPVNINLASTEVLTATLAGIAGRARYIWPHQVHRKTVEEGTKFQDPDADNQEEDDASWRRSSSTSHRSGSSPRRTP